MPDGVYGGSDLTADLEAVWKAIVESFPNMAAAYQSANAAVHETFRLPSNGQTRFLPNWRALRDLLQVILGDSSTNLIDTAAALRESMIGYADSDAAAAEALADVWKDYPEDLPWLPLPRTPYGFRSRATVSGPTGYDHYLTVDPRYGYDPYRTSPGIQIPRDVYDSYTGGAPTEADLLSKARTVDDKLLAAAKSELNWWEQAVAYVVPDDWIISDAEALGYVTIEDMLADQLRGEPAAYQAGVSPLRSITQFNAAEKPFGRFTTEVSNAKDALDPNTWDSDAARTFREEFLNAYEDIAETQAQLLGELLGAIRGYQQALEDTYRAYDEAMDQTIAALNGIIDGAKSAAVGLFTAVLSATVSFVGTVATGGGATAVRFALANAAISIASASYSVGGTSANEVSINIREAILTIKEKLETFDDELTDALGQDVQQVALAKAMRGRITLPRPNFIYAPGGFLD